MYKRWYFLCRPPHTQPSSHLEAPCPAQPKLIQATLLWTAKSSCCPKTHVILSSFFSKASREIWQNSKTNPRIQFMLHLDQHLLTPRNFWKQTIGPSVEASRSSVWWRIMCWWTVYIWVSDESYSSPKGHHQVGASPIVCQCLVILHTCVYSAIERSSAIDLVMLFLCKWLPGTIILMWKRRTKKRSCLRHHLDCMRRFCWPASVACVGLFSSAYPIVVVFCNFFLVECLHRRLAACIFDLSLRIPHCSSLLALLCLPMSLDSGKRKTDTVRHTTWIKCIESETRHTYTWSIWCWQKRLQIWVFMMQSKAVVATGLSRQICHGFWVSVGIGWGIGGWYREYVKNCHVAINWRHANYWLQDCKFTLLRPTGFARETRALRL